MYELAELKFLICHRVIFLCNEISKSFIFGFVIATKSTINQAYLSLIVCECTFKFSSSFLICKSCGVVGVALVAMTEDFYAYFYSPLSLRRP